MGGPVKRVTLSYAELDSAAERLAAMQQGIVWEKAAITFKLNYHRKMLELLALTGLEVTVGDPPLSELKPIHGIEGGIQTKFDDIDQNTGQPRHLQHVEDTVRRMRGMK